MSAPVVLAVDQGTSATKAIVVAADDTVLSSAEVAVRPVYLPGGGVEQDPQALLDSVLDSGRRALADAGVAVDVVALANQGETVLAWDPDTGDPLGPAVGWQDRRADTICDDLSEYGASIAARTGLVLDPYFSAPKMAWLRRHGAADGVVTTVDSWLVHRLAGAFVTDASTASRSLLTTLESVTWDDELRARFGLGDERMPDIAASDAVVGTSTCFGSDVPVGGLVLDQPAALLAEGGGRAGAVKCTLGTGAFLLADAGRTPRPSTRGLTTSVAWRAQDTDTYCLDGQVYTAASAVRWLVDLGVLGSPDGIDAAVSGTDGVDRDGPWCVPALAGLAAPWWRPDASATLAGLRLSSGRAEVVLAVVQGLAAQVAELLDAVGADRGLAVGELAVDGGLTRSTAVVQALADVTQSDIVVYGSPHATALGAAALGRRALQPGRELAQCVPAVPAARRVRPNWDPERAASFRSRWRDLADRTLPEATS